MIYLGADHGGYELKKKVMKWLTEWKYKYEDLGPTKLDPEDDYPVYAFAVAEKVATEDDIEQSWKKRAKGILICRSAIGVTVAANKYPRVRAGAAYDTKAAEHARTNDDINVLGLSGDWMTDKQAKEVIKVWLETDFSREDRHARRVNLIVAQENEFMGGDDGCQCCGQCHDGEEHDHEHDQGHEHTHAHKHEHGHSHGEEGCKCMSEGDKKHSHGEKDCDCGGHGGGAGCCGEC